MSDPTKPTPPTVNEGPIEAPHHDWAKLVPDSPSRGEKFELPHDDIRFVFNAKNSVTDASSLAPSYDSNIPLPAVLAKRFSQAPKHLLEKGLGPISAEQWGDWRWQQRSRFRNLKQLGSVFSVSDDERVAFEKSDAMFNMAVTPYYASLMDPEDPLCPIRLQSVPQLGELLISPEDLEDPLGEEKDMPVPGITHRYPDRVLFYTTHNCPVYCRHCTRKRKVSDPTSTASRDQIEIALAFIGAGNVNDQLVVFGLLFTRLIVVVNIVPFLGSQNGMPAVRMCVAVALALLFWPQLYAQTSYIPSQSIEIILLLIKEAFVGFVLGFVSAQVFYALSIGGQLIDLFRGASMIQVTLPQFRQQASPLATMLVQLFVVLFLTLGFQGLFFDALAQSFVAIPLTKWPAFSTGIDAMAFEFMHLFSQIFMLGFKLSIPVAIVVLVINIAFGLMNRVAPQINAFFMSMPATALGGLMIFFAASTSTIEQFSALTRFMLMKLAEMMRLFS